MPERKPRPPGPLHLLWAARWEHDKNPGDLFRALAILLDDGMDFQISVIGQRFRTVPGIFGEWRPRLGDRIVHWGFLPDRDAYVDALGSADVILSTARHEFFGIGIMEGVAAGAYPLVPRRLSYPELLDADAHPEFFYDGSPESLAAGVRRLAERLTSTGSVWEHHDARALAAPYLWPSLAQHLDDRLDALGGKAPGS